MPSCKPILIILALLCVAGAAHAQNKTFYAQADALVLTRADNRANPLLAFNAANGQQLLRADDINSWAVGPRILVGAHLNENWTTEVSYFGMNFWDETAVVTGNNNLQVPGELGMIGADFDDADRIGYHYTSEVHNLEANLGYGEGAWQLFGGFRYFQLSEGFDLNALDQDLAIFGAGGSNYNLDVSNQLYGGQIGGTYAWRHDAWTVTSTAKGGAYGNNAKQRQSVAILGDQIVLRDTASADTTASFIGEINLTAAYQINCNWSLFGGYNLLWATGVALAPNQVDFSLSNANSGQVINTDGTMFAHGASVGIAASY